MTAWERLWDTLRWTAPWLIFVVGIAGLLLGTAWVSHSVTRWWIRRHIKDELGEIAQAEIEKRDALITELRSRVFRIEEEDRKIRAMGRAAISAITGIVQVGNTCDTEMPSLMETSE